MQGRLAPGRAAVMIEPSGSSGRIPGGGAHAVTGAADNSQWDVPAPVLFNPWKHHAGFLRHRVAQTARGGEEALRGLAAELVVIGSELMDLYLGPLSPRAIAEGVTAALRADGRLDPAAYRAWLANGGGY